MERMGSEVIRQSENGEKAVALIEREQPDMV